MGENHHKIEYDVIVTAAWQLMFNRWCRYDRNDRNDLTDGCDKPLNPHDHSMVFGGTGLADTKQLSDCDLWNWW